jgi:cysteine synthase A
VLSGGTAKDPNHRIQGGGYSLAELPLLAGTIPAGYLRVSDQEAMQTARRLAREEGIFAGFSSGANASAALRLLEGPERDAVVVVTICDTGLKYLSTDLWP